MNATTVYLLEASVCLGVFYLFYLAVLYRQPMFHYNRVYLLATSALSWVLPMLNVPLATGGSSSTGASTAYLLLAPAGLGGDNVALGEGWPWMLFVYAAGVSVATLYYGCQFYQLRKVQRNSQEQAVPHRRYRLFYTQGRFPTASFFRYLFWDNTQPLTVEETRQMMLHEETHIRRGHSYDVLYLTLLKILGWFHPLVYLYDRALVQIHEYEADAAVLVQASVGQRAYARLLSKRFLSSRNVLPVNRFYYSSLILNRIHMIYSTKRTPWYRYVLIVPVFMSLFFTFSCQPNEEEVTREAVAQSYEDIQNDLAKVDQEIQAIVSRHYPTQKQFEKELNRYLEEGQGPPDEVMLLKEKASSNELTRVKKLIGLREELREKLAYLPDTDGVYTVVENRPEPKGGMRAFYQHIGDNMRYPTEARQAGVEGKVFVQFVVDEYGEITQTKILKGIGEACDQEALRVLQEAPEWHPGTTNGQAVNVQMVLPITFKLDKIDAPASLKKDSPNGELSAAEEKAKIDEMVIVGYQ
jgi:TonB family protein